MFVSLFRLIVTIAVGWAAVLSAASSDFGCQSTVIPGSEKLAILLEINSRLERGEITSLSQAIALGWVIESGEEVYRQGPDGNDLVTNDEDGEPVKQRMPFKVWRLPHAHTGLYYPQKTAMLKVYNGMQLVLPGIGAEISTAKTLFDIAQTFVKGVEIAPRRLRSPVNRLLSVPLDASGNGLAKGWPTLFGTLPGAMAVVRHAHLILRLDRADSPFRNNPHFPFFVAGRSQGGLIALKYGMYYKDFNGVLAVNPAHSDPEIVAETHRIHRIEDGKSLFGNAEVVYNSTWEDYLAHTPTFELDRGRSLVPTAIILGVGDPGYPHPLYDRRIAEFQRGQPDFRRLYLLKTLELADRHNLWDRKRAPYGKVTQIMSNFYRDQMPESTDFYLK